jgi:hypothetical protein
VARTVSSIWWSSLSASSLSVPSAEIASFEGAKIVHSTWLSVKACSMPAQHKYMNCLQE